MSKFSGKPVRRNPVSQTVGQATTNEGGRGFKYDPRTELWNLTTAAMVGGEKSFYEDERVRDERLRSLVHKIVSESGGFEWISRFVPYLRNNMFMRTAPIIIAAEAAHSRLSMVKTGPVPEVSPEFTVRRLVASAIRRGDEYAEFIGYWRSQVGRTIPGGVQRGIADAFQSVNEYTALKYDGTDRPIRLGDVVEIVHPTPKDPAQSDLFAYLLDRRHNPKEIRTNLSRLPMIAAWRRLEEMPREERERIAAGPELERALSDAGMTWGGAAGWLRRKLTAKEWAALIPSMGYMALLRNLRNFDGADIDDATARVVAERLSDPDQVRRSMQFPYRFYTAYRAAQETFRWAEPLSRALDISTENVPVLSGRTLVLVDTSASMETPISNRSKVQCVDVAALFAAAVVARNPSAIDVVSFATSAEKISFPSQRNVLRNVDYIRGRIGMVGHGTNVNSGLQFMGRGGYNRIVIFSDMQDVAGIVHNSYYRSSADIPEDVTVFSFNLAGYESGIVDTSIPNRFLLAGFSDAAFRMMSMVERGAHQEWPF